MRSRLYKFKHCSQQELCRLYRCRLVRWSRVFCISSPTYSVFVLSAMSRRWPMAGPSCISLPCLSTKRDYSKLAKIVTFATTKKEVPNSHLLLRFHQQNQPNSEPLHPKLINNLSPHIHTCSLAMRIRTFTGVVGTISRTLIELLVL